MAVRDDFTAGEVLAAADLNDTFAEKVPFAYGTATPSTTVEGFVWYDENDTPPTPKFWDGSEFVPFPSGAGDAVISSPAATGNYTDDGVEYDYYTFNSSGTLTVDEAGFADVLVVGGGGAGSPGDGGGGGAGGMLVAADAYFPSGTLTVTIGAGGSVSTGVVSNNGNSSHIHNFIAPGGGAGGRGIGSSGGFNGGSGGGGGGAGIVSGGSGLSLVGNNGGAGSGGKGGGGGGAGAAGNAGNVSNGTGGAGLANSYTGLSVTYAAGGDGDNNNNTQVNGSANTGNGGKGTDGGSSTASTGGSGVVIVRVKV